MSAATHAMAPMEASVTKLGREGSAGTTKVSSCMPTKNNTLDDGYGVSETMVNGFALGILYAYWREKSGSVLAPIIGHDVSDVVEYALVFLMTWLWS